jgi:hypothetical protein
MLDHLSFHHNTTIHHKAWKNGFSAYIQAFTDRESNFYNQIVVQTRFQVKMIVVMAALMAMWPKQQHKTQNAKCKKMYQGNTGHMLTLTYSYLWPDPITKNESAKEQETQQEEN